MALICAKAKEAFDYVMSVVFQVPKEGLLYKALENSGDTDIISHNDADIESLTYDRSSTDKDVSLYISDKSLLHFLSLHPSLPFY